MTHPQLKCLMMANIITNAMAVSLIDYVENGNESELEGPTTYVTKEDLDNAEKVADAIIHHVYPNGSHE